MCISQRSGRRCGTLSCLAFAAAATLYLTLPAARDDAALALDGAEKGAIAELSVSSSSGGGGRDPCIMHKGEDPSTSGIVLVPAMWVNSYPVKPWHREYDVCAYQRKNPTAPAYVPNLSFEAGIYLRYIVDHYHALPEIMIFIQEDAGPDEHMYMRCLRRDDLSWNWSPVTVHDYWQRGPEIWKNICEEDVHACWVALAADFNIELPTATLPRVGMYGRANFAITGEQVRRTPYASYLAAYTRLVLSPHCTKEDVWNGKPITKRCSDKDTGGCTFEHLHHALLGGQPLVMDRFTQKEWCARYVKSDVCPGSLCKGE